MTKNLKAELNAIQQEIDRNTSEYVQQDFMLKLNSHQKVSKHLEKRDNILLQELPREEILDLYRKVVKNFPPIADYFPLKEGDIPDISFLKMLRVDYLENFKLRVTLEMYENEYVENTVLTKTMNLYDSGPETTPVKYKENVVQCPLFDFFNNDEDDFESFDIFYEFYMHMLFLAEDSEIDQ